MLLILLLLYSAVLLIKRLVKINVFLRLSLSISLKEVVQATLGFRIAAALWLALLFNFHILNYNIFTV